MDTYMKYKIQLKDLRYPNIEAFKDEEIRDLFLSKNRSLLLTWLVKVLNPELTFSLECSKTAELADYLYETGFCTSSQKLPFVLGICSLDNDIQIFDRIFNFMKQLNEDGSMDSFENNSQNACVDDFLTKDINLFPLLRTLTVFTEEERLHILANYKDKIQELTELTDENVNSVDNNFDVDNYIFEDSIIYSNMESFKEHVKNLSRATSVIVGNTEQLQTKSGFKENITRELNNCCNEMRPVLQYFKNSNLIKSINDELNDRSSTIQDNEILEILISCAKNFAIVAKSLRN